jgi:hypothetical protein
LTVGANLTGAVHVEPFTGDWFSQFGLSTSRARIYFAHVIVLSSI